ncbi:DEAD/DEAH box helicase [Pseudomonadota bacterium]
MAISGFHPAVQSWFSKTFESATPVQQKAWEAIRTDQNVLIAAPTGSGKTFAAFLCAIDELVRDSQHGALNDAVKILYISPLKALSNDIERNLRLPLEGIDEWLLQEDGRSSGIRAMVRTGDTTPGERDKMRRKPPQILVTTPESLYLLLTSDSGRSMLAGVQTVIVDEIHAVAGSKRGSHLSLSLARLDALVNATGPGKVRRIGLSATQNPIMLIADYLTGGNPCAIVDTGHQKDRDLSLVIPESPLSPVMANEVWEEIYDQIEELIEQHRTTLIFVNTRRLAERLARHLAERIGEESVTAHHGSLSRDHRLEAEQALKSGRLRALVATASLELGIDIGHVDLVCQIGSPGSISAFIQRVGRAGHAVGETPKGRLFPVSRDDLLESVALLRAVQDGLLDRVMIPEEPLDVLAQQVIAEVSAREWGTDALLQVVRSAWPYRNLSEKQFGDVIDMLANGYATRRGRRSAYLYHDAINERLRPRPAARLTALQNGGAIPDHFDYEVLMMPQGFRVGTLNEDFAFESLPGDIFQLGNTSYRILKIEQSRVLVEDAKGQPPTIPFWFGDAPGRSDELSAAVSGLREDMDELLGRQGVEAAMKYLEDAGIKPAAAMQLVSYLAAARDALGCIPTQQKIVMERFFDDTGDMHLVVHAPLGSRIMRAWGLALRKRFCRHFNFELQAAALEDCLILSLGETHSFETKDVPAYLKSATVRQVLIQALLDAPLFEVRWRWNATIALAVQRMRNGQKLPPQWQRNQAEDLVAVVFPDQLACLENIRGEREIPDHPLVNQTISDCMTESMDIDGLEALLKRIEAQELDIFCLDLHGPSPLAAEIINARPYAFLDDGEAENRRTRAISQPHNDLSDAATLSIISVDATEQVRSEAWIRPRSPDELHDGLLQLGFLTEQEYSTGTSSAGMASSGDWSHWFKSLAGEFRASCVTTHDRKWWVATERLDQFLAVHPDAELSPDPVSVYPRDETDPERAVIELVRSRLSGLGPVSGAMLAEDFMLKPAAIEAALLALQTEGYVMVMGQSHEGASPEKTWCERRLLARIHRYSRERRRKAARPVPPAAFMRFLLEWHGLDEPAGELEQVLGLLEGWSAPVAAWEQGLLASRCADYSPQRLDEQFLSGFATWFRPAGQGQSAHNLVAATPIVIVPRSHADSWNLRAVIDDEPPGGLAGKVLEALNQQGAMFMVDLERTTGLMQLQLEQAIAELVARGRVTSDAFSPLRWLIRPESEKRRKQKLLARRKVRVQSGLLGRWSVSGGMLTDSASPSESELFQDQARLARVCEALLRRYGVVFRAVIERETQTPPWRYLLRYLRRMEDRGEVYGGRFVDGFSGEQFALPEAVGLLRRHGKEPAQNQFKVINATDPLNLGGIITPGVKTASKPGNRILLSSGVPVARIQGDELELLAKGSAIGSAEAERYLRVVRGFPRSQSK